MVANPNNQKIKNEICGLLVEGLYKKDAAMIAGISEKTFYRWISEDDSFDSQVEASILEYKHSLLKKINLAAEKDGRLALEVLSRRFPNEWSANRVYDKNSDEESIQKIADLLQRQYETTNALRLGRNSS